MGSPSPHLEKECRGWPPLKLAKQGNGMYIDCMPYRGVLQEGSTAIELPINRSFWAPIYGPQWPTLWGALKNIFNLIVLSHFGPQCDPNLACVVGLRHSQYWHRGCLPRCSGQRNVHMHQMPLMFSPYDIFVRVNIEATRILSGSKPASTQPNLGTCRPVLWTSSF